MGDMCVCRFVRPLYVYLLLYIAEYPGEYLRALRNLQIYKDAPDYKFQGWLYVCYIQLHVHAGSCMKIS